MTTSAGTVALAALLTTLVGLLNLAVRRARLAAERADARGWRAMVWRGVQWALGPLFVVTRKVNRFVLLHNAMHGDAFIEAARSSYNLFARNRVHIIVNDSIVQVVLFAGKLFGTGFTVSALSFVMWAVGAQSVPVSVYLFAGALAFGIFHIYSHTVGTAVDAVFICYTEDLERNGDSKDYLLSLELRRTFDLTLRKYRELGGGDDPLGADLGQESLDLSGIEEDAPEWRSGRSQELDLF